MKVWKIIIVPLIILALAITTACSATGNQPVRQYQQVQVVSSDLITRISSSGKIAIVNDAKLAFGSGGKLTMLNAAEGDRVTRGMVLAQLDTSTLELARSQMQLGLAQAQLSQETAEYNLENTRDTENTLKLALLSAQIGLDQAQYNLNTGITAIDYNLAYAELEKAKVWYKYAQDSLTNAPSDKADDWLLALDRAKDRLDVAQTNYDNALSGYNSQDITIRKKQVEAAEKSVAQAQKSLDDLAENIHMKELQVVSANQSVVFAQQALDVAQKQLDNATITAPFDGVVVTLNARVGDIIPSPTVSPQTIIYLVDTNDMETDVNIDEMDIPSVQAGQKAVINIDALPGVTLNGTVTTIAAVSNAPAAATGATVYVAKVRFTIPQGIAVKAGMNANVDIVTDEHENVLLLPNDAIKKDNQGESYVEMMDNQQIVTRPVVIGLSDSTRTEIVSGLSVGDKVVLPQAVGKWSLQAK